MLAVLLASSALSTHPANATQPLQLLTDYPQARCMDGTPGGFYFHGSRLGAAQTKWVLTLQGGGECVSAKCTAKAASALGSSRYFPKSYDFWDEAKVHLADTSCTANPELCDYNQVFLPYCSQDLWTGQRANATSPAGSAAPGWYFAGHEILGAVLDALEAAHGLSAASEIIMSGESAGGFGVYHNVDWLAQRYPRARVVGAPIAGFEFYAWPYTGAGNTGPSELADFSAAAMAHGTYNVLWDSFVPPACLADHSTDPGACLLPSLSYGYVQAPLFIMEAQGDSVVLKDHDSVPGLKSRSAVTPPVQAYMAAFAANQSACLAPAMAPKSADGVFNPSCFIHTGFTSTIKIAGQGYLDAFRSWLGGAAVKLADKCAGGEVLCNPTCPL